MIMGYSKNTVYIHSNDHPGILGDLKIYTIISISIAMITIFFVALNYKFIFDNGSRIMTGIESYSLFADEDKCQLSRDEIKNGLLPINIKSEKIGLDIGIEPVNFFDGKWKVNPDTANYAIGTSMINMTKGNTVIYGQNTPDVFEKIEQLEPGDKIQLSAISNVTKNIFNIDYQIVNTEKNSQDGKMFKQSKSPQTTIISVNESLDEKTHIVLAVPISIKLVKCN